MTLDAESTAKELTTESGFPAFMRPNELASRLRLSPKTLADYRQTGEGPEFVKVSRRCCLYTAAAVEKWLKGRVRASTGPDQAAA